MAEYPSEATMVEGWPAPLYCIYPAGSVPNFGPKSRTGLKYRILDGETYVFTIPTDPPLEVAARKTVIPVSIDGKRVCVEVVMFPPFALGPYPFPLPLPAVPLEDWARKLYYVSKTNGDDEQLPAPQPF